MQIDSVKYPVKSLGPGKRLVIWTIGCSKKCKNCISPRLQKPNQNMEIEVKKLYNHIKEVLGEEKIDGITISGGDPFFQKDELLKLLKQLSKLTKDVLVYTGYTYKEVKELLTKEELKTFEKNVAVLIDGPYIDELNDNMSALKGSTNQTIYIFNDEYVNKYKEYIEEGRKLEIFKEENGIRMIGIQNREDNND